MGFVILGEIEMEIEIEIEISVFFDFRVFLFRFDSILASLKTGLFYMF